jgi:hypothetical protein
MIAINDLIQSPSELTVAEMSDVVGGTCYYKPKCYYYYKPVYCYKPVYYYKKKCY